MESQNVSRPGAFVKAIHVLRDQCKVSRTALQRCQGVMPGIRLSAWQSSRAASRTTPRPSSDRVRSPQVSQDPQRDCPARNLPAERNVGIPDSAEMPAPVRTAILVRSTKRLTSSAKLLNTHACSSAKDPSCRMTAGRMFLSQRSGTTMYPASTEPNTWLRSRPQAHQ